MESELSAPFHISGHPPALQKQSWLGQALNKLLAEKISLFFCWFENPAFGSLEEKKSLCCSSALRQQEEPQVGI